MRTRAPALLVIVCIAGALALARAAAPHAGAPRVAVPPPRSEVPDADTPPVLRRFNSSVTFHAGFDQLPADADLSAGDGKANVPAAEAAEVDRMIGQAVVYRER